jgi:hypothetical protein
MATNDRGEDWTPVSLPPEPLELVDAKLADGTVVTAAWTGKIWWVKDGSVRPVAWRKRPTATFGSLILK